MLFFFRDWVQEETNFNGTSTCLTCRYNQVQAGRHRVPHLDVLLPTTHPEPWVLRSGDAGAEWRQQIFVRYYQPPDKCWQEERNVCLTFFFLKFMAWFPSFTMDIKILYVSNLLYIFFNSLLIFFFIFLIQSRSVSVALTRVASGTNVKLTRMNA